MLVHDLGAGAALRLFEERDAAEVYAVIDANRDHLSRWMFWAPDAVPEQSLEFIRRGRRQIADNDGLQLAITLHGEIVGSIGVHGINWQHRNTSVGYWIAERAQGRGIITAAVRALTDHAFRVWELERMELQAAPENVRSRAVAERLGFRQEGVLRRAWRVGDRWLDHVVYAMLAADWRA